MPTDFPFPPVKDTALIGIAAAGWIAFAFFGIAAHREHRHHKQRHGRRKAHQLLQQNHPCVRLLLGRTNGLFSCGVLPWRLACLNTGSLGWRVGFLGGRGHGF